MAFPALAQSGSVERNAHRLHLPSPPPTRHSPLPPKGIFTSWGGLPFALKSDYNGSCVGSTSQNETCDPSATGQQWTLNFNADRVQFKNVSTGMCLGAVSLTPRAALTLNPGTTECSAPFTWWKGSTLSGDGFASGVFNVSMGPYCLTSLNTPLGQSSGIGQSYITLCSGRALSQRFVRLPSAPPAL